MNCDICKMNESSIFLQRNFGLRKRKYYLCPNCAERLGISSDSENLTQAFATIDEIIKKRNIAIIAAGGKIDSEEFQSSSLPNLTKICPACGSTFDSIFTQGRIGCSECYHTFEDDFIQRYNIESEYPGSLPKRLKGYRSTLTDRVDIRIKLDQAIANEEYEKAALYRDYLKVLEKKQNINVETDENFDAQSQSQSEIKPDGVN